MFCPKCAGQNVEGASYCRVCGANISLVPQALTGRLPDAPASAADYVGRRRRRDRNNEPPSLEKGIVNVFVGIGFIVAALAIMYRFPGGIFWGGFSFPLSIVWAEVLLPSWLRKRGKHHWWRLLKARTLWINLHTTRLRRD
jgi:hypothetical protein